MVLDTSTILAVILGEPEAEALEQKIADDPVRMISATTVLELAMVIEARLGAADAAELDLWLHKAVAEVLPVDAEQIDIARRGLCKFGKGRHPAGLNYGDCFSYALAATRGEPLLFKGDDFSCTDIQIA